MVTPGRNGKLRRGRGAAREEKGPTDFYRAGLILLKRKQEREALVAFERALQLEPADSLARSYYGLCLALTRRNLSEGLRLCEQAAEEEFFRAEVHLNLGKTLLLAGKRQEAERALREALTLDETNRETLRELEKMGVRKRPLVPFLSRGNPLNRWPGLLLHRLRSRS